jgi:hypothetical protein
MPHAARSMEMAHSRLEGLPWERTYLGGLRLKEVFKSSSFNHYLFIAWLAGILNKVESVKAGLGIYFEEAIYWRQGSYHPFELKISPQDKRMISPFKNEL